MGIYGNRFCYVSPLYVYILKCENPISQWSHSPEEWILTKFEDEDTTCLKGCDPNFTSIRSLYRRGKRSTSSTERNWCNIGGRDGDVLQYAWRYWRQLHVDVQKRKSWTSFVIHAEHIFKFIFQRYALYFIQILLKWSLLVFDRLQCVRYRLDAGRAGRR